MTTSTKVFVGALRRVQHGQSKEFTAVKPQAPVRRPARVALMLALAHKIRESIARGKVRDQADVARRLGFTRARLTYLLDLLLLAPDVQERVLFLEAIDGIEPMSERSLRRVGREASWTEQRRHLAVSGSDVRIKINQIVI
jgi:hypothetical protein